MGQVLRGFRLGRPAGASEATSKMHLKTLSIARSSSQTGEATKAHQAVKEMPVSREAGWVVLGEAQMGLGHYRASVLAYRRALELKPGDEEAVAAMSVAQAVLQQTLQQKYSSPDSAIRTTP